RPARAAAPAAVTAAPWRESSSGGPRWSGRRSSPASRAGSAPCWADSASVTALRGELLVLRGREQIAPLLGGRRPDDQHPALAVRIGVDGLGLLAELGVGLHHLAGHRREEVGDGLHRLHHAEGLVRGDLGAGLRQLDEDHVTELLLSEGGDADAHAAAFLL